MEEVDRKVRDLTKNTEEVGVSDMETDRTKNGEEAVKMFGTEAWLAARDLGFRYLITRIHSFDDDNFK